MAKNNERTQGQKIMHGERSKRGIAERKLFEAVSTNIKNRMAKADIGYADLAAALDVTVPCARSYVERGSVTLRTLSRISDALGTKPSALLA